MQIQDGRSGHFSSFSHFERNFTPFQRAILAFWPPCDPGYISDLICHPAGEIQDGRWGHFSSFSHFERQLTRFQRPLF